MFGQYWGMFSEFAPETGGDADFAFHGWALQRLPQIRLTQKFAGNWTVAGAICKPYDPGATDNFEANFNTSTHRCCRQQPRVGGFVFRDPATPGQSGL